MPRASSKSCHVGGNRKTRSVRGGLVHSSLASFLERGKEREISKTSNNNKSNNRSSSSKSKKDSTSSLSSDEVPLYLQPGCFTKLRNIRTRRPLRGSEVQSPFFYYDAASLKLDFEIEFEDVYYGCVSESGRTSELYAKLESFTGSSATSLTLNNNSGTAADGDGDGDGADDDERSKSKLARAWLYSYLKGDDGDEDGAGGDDGDRSAAAATATVTVTSINKYAYCLRKYWLNDILSVVKIMITRYYERLLVPVLVRILNLIDSGMLLCLEGTETLVPLLIRQIRSGNTSELNVYLAGRMVCLFERHFTVMSKEGVLLPLALYTFTRLIYDHFCSIDHSCVGSTKGMEWPLTLTETMLNLSSVQRQNEQDAQQRTIKLVFEHEIEFCAKLLDEHFEFVHVIGRDYLRILQPILKIYKLRMIWCQHFENQPDELKKLLTISTDLFYLVSRIPPSLEKNIYFVIVESEKSHAKNHLHKWIVHEVLKSAHGRMKATFIYDFARYLCAVTGTVSNVNTHGYWDQRESILAELLQTFDNPVDISNCYFAIFFDFILPLNEPLQLGLATIDFGLGVIKKSWDLTQNTSQPMAMLQFLLKLSKYVHRPLIRWFDMNLSNNFGALLSMVMCSSGSGGSFDDDDDDDDDDDEEEELEEGEETSNAIDTSYILNNIRFKARKNLAWILGGSTNVKDNPECGMFTRETSHVRRQLLEVIPARVFHEFSLHSVWYKVAHVIPDNERDALLLLKAKGDEIDDRQENSSGAGATEQKQNAFSDSVQNDELLRGRRRRRDEECPVGALVSDERSEMRDRSSLHVDEERNDEEMNVSVEVSENSFGMLKRLMKQIAACCSVDEKKKKTKKKEDGDDSVLLVHQTFEQQLPLLCANAIQECTLAMVVNVLQKVICNGLSTISLEPFVIWKRDSLELMKAEIFSQANIWAIPVRIVQSLYQNNEKALQAIVEFLKLLYGVDERYAAIILLAIALEEDKICAKVLQRIFKCLESANPAAVVVKKVLLHLADWNDCLFTFIVPYIMDTFVGFVGHFDIIEQVCTKTNQRQISELVMGISLGLFKLMSLESALENVRASAHLDSHSLSLFFQILEAHSLWIPLNSYAGAFLTPINHAVDASIAQILKREHSPNARLIQLVFSRRPDTFTSVVLSAWCVHLKKANNLRLMIDQLANVLMMADNKNSNENKTVANLKQLKDRIIQHLNQLKPIPICQDLFNDQKLNTSIEEYMKRNIEETRENKSIDDNDCNSGGGGGDNNNNTNVHSLTPAAAQITNRARCSSPTAQDPNKDLAKKPKLT